MHPGAQPFTLAQPTHHWLLPQGWNPMMLSKEDRMWIHDWARTNVVNSLAYEARRQVCSTCVQYSTVLQQQRSNNSVGYQGRARVREGSPIMARTRFQQLWRVQPPQGGGRPGNAFSLFPEPLAPCSPKQAG